MQTSDNTPSDEAASDPASIPSWVFNRQQVAAIAEAAKKKRIADESAEMSRKISRKGLSSTASAAAKQESLAQYPSIPLSEYVPNGDHLAINVDFPGLRAIHKEPWIFLVRDLLTREECEQLMSKAEAHCQPSYSYSNGHRTSSECRIARTETQRIQGRYSKLLRMPIENFEAAKVSRYRTGALHGVVHHCLAGCLALAVTVSSGLPSRPNPS